MGLSARRVAASIANAAIAAACKGKSVWTAPFCDLPPKLGLGVRRLEAWALSNM
jgi:hypothetical protein